MKISALVLALVLSVAPFSLGEVAEEAPPPADIPSDNATAIDSGIGRPVHALPVQSADAPVASGLGLGQFSHFPFRLVVETRGGWDDNVSTTNAGPKQGSAFANTSLLATYDFGNARTRLNLSTGGGITYYFDRPNDSSPDVNAFVGLTVTHKATNRLTLSVNAYAAYQVEPDFALNVGLDRRSGNYFYTADKFTALFLWTPRFSTATSFSFGATKYDDSAIGFYSDRFEYTFGNEFRYLLWPTTTLVAEYRFGIVDYTQFTADSSTTHFLLGGFDHNFSPRLSLSVRAGEEFRSYNSNNEQTSPYFQGTLSYAINKRTSAAITAQYSIEEADVSGEQGRTTFRTGLQLKYGISPRLTATVAANYQHNNYDQGALGNNSLPTFTEDAVDLSVQFRYTITRNWGLELGDDFTQILSDQPGRQYSRNRAYFGATLAF